MKAKILLTALFLFSFLQNSIAQDYHPLLDNSSWIVRHWVSCCNAPYVRTISAGADIVIGNYTYTAYDDPFVCGSDSNFDPVYTLYVRENVAERKVYKLVEGVDTILYDFSMENGDTITQYGYTWTATVDEIAVNNGTRKRITLHSVYNNGHDLKQIWIEGVGSDKHPFYPNHNMFNFMSAGGGVILRTVCVYQNGVHEYGDDSCEALLSTSTQKNSAKKITFSPNPFTTQLTITSETALVNADFKLYNLQGQLIYENNFQGTKAIVNREKLSAGLYFAQLFEKGKLIKTEKLMVN